MRTISGAVLALALLASPGCTAEAEPHEPADTSTPAIPAKDRGAEVFATHCAVCHGPEGKGDGPGATGLDPAPSDLVGPRADHLKGIPRRLIIEEGRPGTAMVGWKGVLSDDDLAAVYGFVHTMKHGPGGGGHGPGKGGGHRQR